MSGVTHLLTQVTTTEPGNGDAILKEGGIEADAWIAAAAILVGAFLLAFALRRVSVRLVESRESAPRVALVVGRFVSVVIVLAGLVYALNTLGVQIGPLLGALGIGGIALAFALQHVLENSVAAMLIQARRPFVAGDQISSCGERGTVEEVNFRAVVLRTEGNNRVFLPSAEVLRTPLVNHTAFDRRRTALVVGLPYGCDLDSARDVLLEAVAAAPGVLEFPHAEAFVEEYADSSVNVALRFWHPPRIADEWRVRDEVARSVRRGLAAAGIEIPFPQRTVWFAEREGSPAPVGSHGDGNGGA